MFSLTKTSSRQREIVEIVLGNGWDYMRGILTVGKSDKPQLPPPEVFRKTLVQLGSLKVFSIKIRFHLGTKIGIFIF